MRCVSAIHRCTRDARMTPHSQPPQALLAAEVLREATGRAALVSVLDSAVDSLRAKLQGELHVQRCPAVEGNLVDRLSAFLSLALPSQRSRRRQFLSQLQPSSLTRWGCVTRLHCAGCRPQPSHWSGLLRSAVCPALAAAQATTPRRTWRSVCRLHVSARRTISTDECTRCRRSISLASPQLLASLPSGRRALTTGGHTHAVLHS
jgi:hypothetical protein